MKTYDIRKKRYIIVALPAGSGTALIANYHAEPPHDTVGLVNPPLLVSDNARLEPEIGDKIRAVKNTYTVVKGGLEIDGKRVFTFPKL